MLDYVCILDFEATCDDKPKFKPQEIIEFPVIVWSLKEKKQVAEFHEYVRPIHNPKLTSFCTELTGITQSTVDAAQPFEYVWERFIQFMIQTGLIDESTHQPIESFGFVTCGDWDFQIMLPAQMSLQPHLKIPSWLKRWVNIKKIYMNHFNQKAGGMMGLLRALGIEHKGRHHNGLDDTRNILAITTHLAELTPIVLTYPAFSDLK